MQWVVLLVLVGIVILCVLMKKNKISFRPNSSLDKDLFEAVSGPLVMDVGYVGPGNVEKVKRLLQRGANPKATLAHGSTLLMRAKSSNLEMIKTLLAAGVDVNRQDNFGNTALMLHLENPEAVKLLLQAGAQVQITDQKGNNALMRAGKKGLAETVRLLLEAGTSVEQTNKQGQTALMLACSLTLNPMFPSRGVRACNEGHLATVQSLLQYNAPLNAQDKSGKTALMYAVQLADLAEGRFILSACGKSGEWVQLVRLLLEKGAQVNCKDKAGKTALDYALAAKQGLPDGLKRMEQELEQIITILKSAEENK